MMSYTKKATQQKGELHMFEQEQLFNVSIDCDGKLDVTIHSAIKDILSRDDLAVIAKALQPSLSTVYETLINRSDCAEPEELAS